MITQEKLIIAYRYKETKKTYKNGLISAIFLSALAFFMAFVLMFVKADGNDKGYKFAVIGILYFCSIFFLCMIPLILKGKKQMIENNLYPREAIFFENGSICIQTDVITRIKLLDIKKVSIINNFKLEKDIILKGVDAEYGGSISIITEKENFFIPQLENVEKVKSEILRIRDTKTYMIDEICFVLNNLNEYQAVCIFGEKKVEFSFDNKEDEIIFSVDTTRYLINNFEKIYEKILNETSKDILELANEWNEEENIKFTEKIIKERIDKNNVYISIRKDDFTVYLDDDYIFFGHSIVYNGNITNNNFYVDIAG